MRRISMRLLALAALVGCGGGADRTATTTPASSDDFADVDACLRVTKGGEIAAVAAACGGDQGASAWQKLERAAVWLAGRRAAAQQAGKTELVAEIDAVTDRAVFVLPLEGTSSDYELPVSTEGKAPVRTVYTVVTADATTRLVHPSARLKPSATPPIERSDGKSDVVGYPILVVADDGVLAARIIAAALDQPIASAELAVRTAEGEAGAHPVVLSHSHQANLPKVGIAPKGWRVRVGTIETTVESAIRLEQELKRARTDDVKTVALDLPPGATASELVAVLDAAARAGYSAATLPPPPGVILPPPAGGTGDLDTKTVLEKSVKVHLDSPPVVNGVDLAAASDRIAAAIQGATDCFSKKGVKIATGARFTVQLVVDKKGKVKKASVADLADRKLARCAARPFQKLTLSPPADIKAGVALGFVVELPPEAK